uniref:Uncharacterized protein n=1 Tax=Mola mola TaxID=94237 RepID=A0A3Q3WYG7_MOLML
AVPRTPPPRSPNPSPERTRSALAAAILSSSLTGQPWAIPPARPRSFCESGQSASFISKPNIRAALHARDRWSVDLGNHLHPSSPEHSEEELEIKEEEVESEEDREEHVYQTLDGQESCSVTEPAELQKLRQHAQELVDENDALKLTVHRLNVELSRYQTCFKPLSKQEMSMRSSRKKGVSVRGKLDMKYLSPLLLAYEDRMNEKDTLLQTIEEEVKRLRAHVEEVIKENEGLHDEIAKVGGVRQKDCHQLQQQAFLVLQENQVLIDQLEAQHVKAKARKSRHHSEVAKVWKQLMLLEAEKNSLQEDLDVSREEAQKNMREIQALQARLKDDVTFDEHFNITGKLRRQLEQEESRNKSEMEKLLRKLSSLQEENRTLALDKANLTADLKRLESELELKKQANRKAERRMSVLKRQREEYILKEEKTRHYMEAVLSVVEHVSREREHLIQMASVLQREKQGFINRIVNGTVRFGKLQEEIKFFSNLTQHEDLKKNE